MRGEKDKSRGLSLSPSKEAKKKGQFNPIRGLPEGGLMEGRKKKGGEKRITARNVGAKMAHCLESRKRGKGPVKQ